MRSSTYTSSGVRSARRFIPPTSGGVEHQGTTAQPRLRPTTRHWIARSGPATSMPPWCSEFHPLHGNQVDRHAALHNKPRNSRPNDSREPTARVLSPRPAASGNPRRTFHPSTGTDGSPRSHRCVVSRRMRDLRITARCRGSRPGNLRPSAQAPEVCQAGDELGYLLRALRKTYYSWHRAAARRPATVTLAEDQHDATLEPAFGAGEITRAIASAPAPFRDAVIAVDVVGLSYKEAARALRTREATITSRLHRGRQHVARALTETNGPN